MWRRSESRPAPALAAVVHVLVAFVLTFALVGAGKEKPAEEEVAPEPTNPLACVTCHSTHGAAGHFPPETDGCVTCHSILDPEATIPEGAHVELTRADSATCSGCHAVGASAHAHEPVRDGQCLSCHDAHDPRKGKAHLGTTTERETCEECHELEATRFTHQPVRLGRCSGCHDAHGSEEPGLLRTADQRELCGTCHPDEVAKHPVDHWPTAQGECSLCHDPHGSEHEFNLHRSVKDTCYLCHPSKEDNVQVHSAVVLGRCSKCHNPHGSEHDRKLRGDPVSEVCFGCHADDITGRPVVHKPIADGNCLMCHDPHTSPQAKNLRTTVNMTCAQCHPDKYRPDVMTPHPAVMSYGCTTCHDPHASDHEFRLRKPIVEMCTSCHNGYDDGYHVVQRPTGGGHPIGDKPDPLRPGRTLTCTSCHDPHGTENPRMWYRAYQRLALCVECHRRTLAPHTEPGESQFEKDAEAARQRDLELKESEK